ncbi:MAG: zinc finger domain-containing protein [Aigarchaeota archaeon]|nr:zinc finger domain-containing protein [Aigarchaeota archaeon]
MTKGIVYPLCTSCNRPISPDEKSVNFPCPNCSKIVIWRCELCRELARIYVCPSCSFEGP